MRAGLMVICCVSLWLSPAALAQDGGEVEVEAIVFAFTERPESSIARVPPRLAIGTATEISADGSALYGALPPTQLGLSTAYSRLSTDRRSRALMHLGWRQPASDSRSVRLRSAEVEGLSVDGRVLVETGGDAQIKLELILTDASGAQYLIEQSREIKPGDTQYFDHPAFGAIVRVRRFATLVNENEL